MQIIDIIIKKAPQTCHKVAQSAEDTMSSFVDLHGSRVTESPSELQKVCTM